MDVLRSKKTNEHNRTKSVNINLESEKNEFDKEVFNIGITQKPRNNDQNKKRSIQETKRPVFGEQTIKHSGKKSAQKKDFLLKSSGKKLESFFWRGLEWITTSSAIFIVFFLILNFASYSELFKSKINQIRGVEIVNPITAEEIERQRVRNVAPEEQKPLAITHRESESKKQIPTLDLEIVPPDDRIIIDRIGRSVPIIRVSTELLLKRDWFGLEAQIQEALRYGVVHFPGTALPGRNGNVVVTGHSSYFPWDPGRFKDVFALLHQVSIGDEIVVYYNQGKFRYIVYDKFVVNPDQVEVMTQTGENRLTLITCTPVGTNLRRLIVLARPV